MDYYRILGLGKNASSEDIKKAYKILAKKYHPDLNKDSNAEYLFIQIKEAYDTLNDQNKRREYDNKMGFGFNDAYNHYESEETNTTSETPQDDSYEEPQQKYNNDKNQNTSGISSIRSNPKKAILAVVTIAVISVILAVILFNKPQQVTAVRLNNDTLHVESGDNLSPYLVATVLPTRASTTGLIWTSSNPQVVEIYNPNNMIARDEGTAIITIKDQTTGHQAQCKVTVSLKSVTNHQIGLAGKYTGTIKGNQPHGQGILDYHDGGRYEGEWSNGKRHGEGTLAAPSFEKYTGSWRNDDLHGAITVTYPEGHKYLFQFINGKPVENGLLVLANGTTYKATFKDGYFRRAQ